jgi:hypothetical protein
MRISSFLHDGGGQADRERLKYIKFDIKKLCVCVDVKLEMTVAIVGVGGLTLLNTLPSH